MNRQLHFKKYMEENGRKQVEVAAELGVSGGLVSSFLAGTYKTPHAIIPKVQELAKIHERKRSHRRSRILWKLPSAVP